jgi:hypothetical protein
MRVSQITTYLKEKDSVPEARSPEYETWLDFKDVLEFLLYSATGQIPVYISSKYFYLYSVIVPKFKLKGNYTTDLMQWNFGVSGGWGYGCEYARKTGRPKKRIFPPLDGTRSSILDGGEAIFFLRSLYHDADSYLELNQRLAHVLDIHKIEQRKAYCKVDEETGDLVDIVTFSQDDGILCTIESASLDFYLFLTNSVLVRVFDVTRFSSPFHGWHDDIKTATYTNKVNEIYARRGLNISIDDAKEAGYIRGVQIIRQVQSDKQMMCELQGERTTKKEYATFLAYDFKHKKIQECSCDPDKLGNYFVESDLPFETTPAFFRPEVMLRYKQNPDKYIIDAHSITCRSAWHLRYNSNDEGQIQIYLIDLSHLPSSEQLYWKSFNEKPKVGIAEHVYKRDFLGSWDLPHDPLESMKQLLRDFPCVTYRGEKIALLRCAKDKQLAKLTYVMTDATKEWEDQILQLAKVLGDGLDKTEIRKIAKYLKCDDSQLGSIKLLKKCLETKGLDAEVIETIIQPLQTVYGLRSTIAAHLGRNAPDENLKEHHRKLVEDCEKAVEQLAELMSAGYLDIPLN